MTTAADDEDFQDEPSERTEPIDAHQKNIIRIEDIIAQIDHPEQPSLDLERFEEIHNTAKTAGRPINLDPDELETYEHDAAHMAETMGQWKVGLMQSMPSVTAAIEKATAKQKEMSTRMLDSIRGSIIAPESAPRDDSLNEFLVSNAAAYRGVQQRKVELEEREITKMEITAAQLEALKAVSNQLEAHTTSMERQEKSSAKAATYARRRDWAIFSATVFGIIVAIILAIVTPK